MSNSLLSAILYGIILTSIMIIGLWTYNLRTFITNAYVFSNEISINGVDKLSDKYDLYTMVNGLNLYDNYQGYGLYLMGDYDKNTKNDIDYIHSKNFPSKIFYCDKILYTSLYIKCIRIY